METDFVCFVPSLRRTQLELIWRSVSTFCCAVAHESYVRVYNKNELRNSRYEDIIFSWIKTNPYNFLFKVPIVGNPEHDGLRATDVKFQQEINQRMENFLKEKSIQYMLTDIG